MIDFILNTLSCYALTLVITSAAILDNPRNWIITKTPYLMAGNKHLLSCRMCIGLWISIAICNMDYKLILPVYGLSYFLATQERK